MMMLDSGTVRSVASSCSTGIFRTGQSLRNFASDSAFPKSTRTRSNGVSFS